MYHNQVTVPDWYCCVSAGKRLLEFYFDFVDWYFNCWDFELIQMDTDSNYIAISPDQLQAESEATKRVACMEQVEQRYARAVQTRM